MAIDPAVIGTELAPTTLTVDEGRLRFFAKAIGDTVDDELRVPPTFLFSIELENPDPFGWADKLGIDLRFVLHGEQAFTYHQPAHAGDVLTATPKITDVYSKKGGALDFIVKETAVTNAAGSLVADLKTVIVVRNPGAGK
ncbi:MaoC family dehydratase N-terminal domain-containing protein [Antrihabitans sp. YC2-6]|uniref:MaoC family dehydratase N-terminal domain-containing protein n=1 Tax=Antrihabitans sp. YC2-6 TaxID=2799498 RepID=UPI0018F388EE|nr:MaoC family dehydratase N-terminal domain-containing protein [Antrihabitans sp. YC2-6]MBJ8343860.1 MaoC family dehydratase N-terminal domain-containing protein [Antrihabitans sp. YC2-6]